MKYLKQDSYDPYFASHMITDNEIIRLIFGFKLRYLRLQHHMSYQDLADQTGLSVSYLNDIEKGKRYPKPDKINSIAEAFEVDYNYMVATNASKRLQPIIDLLTSKFFKLFPLEEFGIKTEKLLELFTNTPDKVTSFISTIFKIARNYQVGEPQFYKEALRSYQDMHNNYFPKLEQAVVDFRKKHKVKGTVPYTTSFLESKLESYGVKIDRKAIANNIVLSTIRSYYDSERQILFIQGGLTSAQEIFIIARELGFQHLDLKIRPYENAIIEVDSFEKLLNNYKASHFAAALLMDEQELIADVKQIARENKWESSLISDLIDKYHVTPETLMQRLTNILPHHFGIEDLFFLRLTGDKDLKSYKMTKDLHLSQLHNPYNNELNESYCHRWLSIAALRDLRLKKFKKSESKIIIDAQISKYWQTDNEYLCLTIAKPSQSRQENGVSVTIGMLVNEKLKSTFYFLSDPQMKVREVHTTCERCGIEDCEARVSPPLFIEKEAEREELLENLKGLISE